MKWYTLEERPIIVRNDPFVQHGLFYCHNGYIFFGTYFFDDESEEKSTNLVRLDHDRIYDDRIDWKSSIPFHAIKLYVPFEEIIDSINNQPERSKREDSHE